MDLHQETPNTKRCNKCELTKPIQDFYKSKANYGGYRTICKSCFGNRQKKYPKKYRSQIGSHIPRFLDDKHKSIAQNIQWELDREQHRKIWNSSCHFCGKSGKNIGLGRLNENLGFTLTNSIAKCRYGCIKDIDGIVYKRCNICNTFQLTCEFRLHKTSRYGVTTVCNTCLRSQERIRWMTNKEKRYSYYKYEAKKDHREFSLTFDEFCRFWSKPCWYCNKKISSIGLDRIDNNIGYRIDNVVPCCRDCNTVKNKFTTHQLAQITSNIINGVSRFKYKDTNFGAISLSIKPRNCVTR
jgi:hypothetical protein